MRKLAIAAAAFLAVTLLLGAWGGPGGLFQPGVTEAQAQAKGQKGKLGKKGKFGKGKKSGKGRKGPNCFNVCMSKGKAAQACQRRCS